MGVALLLLAGRKPATHPASTPPPLAAPPLTRGAAARRSPPKALHSIAAMPAAPARPAAPVPLPRRLEVAGTAPGCARLGGVARGAAAIGVESVESAHGDDYRSRRRAQLPSFAPSQPSGAHRPRWRAWGCVGASGGTVGGMSRALITSSARLAQIPSNFTQSVLAEGAQEEKGENARLVRGELGAGG